MKDGLEEHRYDDILELPHPVSRHHPRMSLKNRAAQFSPFAALTGHEEAILEAGRLTEEKEELDENTKAILDRKLQEICSRRDLPEVEITWFRPDEKKEGGSYFTIRGKVKKLDSYARSMILTDGKQIPVDDIRWIEL